MKNGLKIALAGLMLFCAAGCSPHKSPAASTLETAALKTITATYDYSHWGPCNDEQAVFEKTGYTASRTVYCADTASSFSYPMTVADFDAMVYSASFKAQPGTVEIPLPAGAPASAVRCYQSGDGFTSGVTTVYEDGAGVVVMRTFTGMIGVTDTNHSYRLLEYKEN